MARARRAFTLLEVALTMTVLVILAAVFWPNMMALQRGAKLPAAIDDLRGLLVGLRVRAMEEGKSYEFAYSPGSSFFRISTLGAESLAPTPTEDTTERRVLFDSEDLLGEHRLLDEMTFEPMTQDPDSTGSAGGVAMVSLSSGGQSQDGWIPLRFRSDGTVSFGSSLTAGGKARFAIVDQTGVAVEFQIRGLTGMITVSKMFRMASAQPQ